MTDPITQQIRDIDSELASVVDEAEEQGISLNTIRHLLEVHSRSVATRYERSKRN